MELMNCCDYCKYSDWAWRMSVPACKCFDKPIKLSDCCPAWEEREHTCAECRFFLAEGMCNNQHKDSCDVFAGSAACSEFRIR